MRTDQVMTREPVTVRLDDTTERARRTMSEGQFRHLPVLDKDGLLAGILSARDLAAQPDLVHVRDLMQTDVKTVAPETEAYEAAYLLVRHKIGCVPVVEPDNRLVGIVTETDFVRIAYTLLGGRVPLDDLEAEERGAEQI
jgi:CBS domain-containing protein